MDFCEKLSALLRTQSFTYLITHNGDLKPPRLLKDDETKPTRRESSN